MLKTAQNIRVLASGMNQLGAVSQNAKDLGSVANNISKLGGKNIDKAIANMPRISKALNEMMSTLSKAPAVSGNLIQMTNAIANLASQGARAGSIPSADSGDATKKHRCYQEHLIHLRHPSEDHAKDSEVFHK